MAKCNERCEYIVEFLQLYHQHSALWNVKSTKYSDRNLKNIRYYYLKNKRKLTQSRQRSWEKEN